MKDLSQKKKNKEDAKECKKRRKKRLGKNWRRGGKRRERKELNQGWRVSVYRMKFPLSCLSSFVLRAEGKGGGREEQKERRPRVVHTHAHAWTSRVTGGTRDVRAWRSAGKLGPRILGMDFHRDCVINRHFSRKE